MSKKQQFVNEASKMISILENTGDFIFSKVWLTVKTYWILYLISTWLNTSKDLLNWSYGSKPNMAKKLRYLEEWWFITREVDKIDKRVFRFSLTQKANFALEQIFPIYENSVTMIFDWVSDQELDTAFSVIQKCLKNIGKCH